VAGESTPPPSGGGQKKWIIGVLLLLAAGAVWFLVPEPEDTPEPEPAAGPKDAGTQRSTSLAEPTLVIPDEEEEDDAGVDAGTEEEEPERRVVRRQAWSQCTQENIDQSAVASVVQRHRRQVRSCYERRLKVNNVLQGTVVVTLRIGSSGNVAGAQVAAGTLRDAEVNQCIRRLATGWSFPSLKKGRGCTLRVPFNLTPQGP
jgi:outer membrane biosynthesis protein TonB